MKEELTEFIKSAPKAELHIHIEGALNADLAMKLAKRNDLELGALSFADLKKKYAFSDLPSFLDCYYTMMDVLRTKQDFFDLAFDYFSRAFEENIVYTEIFFDPQAHTMRGVPFSDVVDGLIEAQDKAREKYGIESQLIMCFLRDLSEEQAFEVYNQALAFKEKIIGVGLDSDGFENPPSKFKTLFDRARADGFKVTIHAEYQQKDIHNQIFECLDLIEADRIDHGVNCSDQPELMQGLLEKDVGLTVCPLSTLCINGSLTLDRIRILLDNGVKVTINSDDPAYFRGYINQNLIALAYSEMFSFADIQSIIENSFSLAWITDYDREKWINEVKKVSHKIRGLSDISA